MNHMNPTNMCVDMSLTTCMPRKRSPVNPTDERPKQTAFHSSSLPTRFFRPFVHFALLFLYIFSCCSFLLSFFFSFTSVSHSPSSSFSPSAPPGGASLLNRSISPSYPDATPVRPSVTGHGAAGLSGSTP
eukprot:GHVU01038432.1.p1 GENE.GHVU01038432.1~~GHVU01038432.1.p1  ORF type:complete len:130 (-),score=11.65 GHVU01038432.1:96-485(-)